MVDDVFFERVLGDCFGEGLDLLDDLLHGVVEGGGQQSHLVDHAQVQFVLGRRVLRQHVRARLRAA